MDLMIKESEISTDTVLVLATPTFMPKNLLKQSTINMILDINEAEFTMSTCTTIQRGVLIIIIITSCSQGQGEAQT